MNTITYQGNEYRLVRENVGRDSLVGSLGFMRQESGFVTVLDMRISHFNNSAQLTVNKVNLSLEGVQNALKLLLPTKDDHVDFMHELSEMEYCPKCNQHHELLPVMFKSEYNDLCSSCMDKEMDDNGIGECDKCRKLDELFEPEDKRLRCYKNLCEDCYAEVTWELQEVGA